MYYIDCSYSMKTNGIWDDVRNNLKNAIAAIKDETTEVLVIPFAFDNKHHSTLEGKQCSATQRGKADLKKYIDNLPMWKSTKTFHSDPIKDFYKYRVQDDRVTYLFLMTDGKNEEHPDVFLQEVKKWDSKYKGKDVYGFYVMLNSQARNPKVEAAIESLEHFWSVETADMNVNLIRLNALATFNARGDQYFDLPLSGNPAGFQLEAKFADDCVLQVTQTKVIGNKLRIYARPRQGTDVHSLPEKQECKLSITMHGGGKLDILGTDSVTVTCLSKRERSLKITIQ